MKVKYTAKWGLQIAEMVFQTCSRELQGYIYTETEESMSMKEKKETPLKAAFTWDELKLNSDGMVCVVVQDDKNKDVLMVAYMNRQAYEKTLETGVMTYWSRSRNELWVKGLTSGHFQYVRSLYLDCDNDTILARVDQVGAACHTGSRSCFFKEIMKSDNVAENS